MADFLVDNTKLALGASYLNIDGDKETPSKERSKKRELQEDVNSLFSWVEAFNSFSCILTGRYPKIRVPLVANQTLLGITWQGKTYVDLTLPFGLRSAPKIFNALADALEWVFCTRGITNTTTLPGRSYYHPPYPLRHTGPLSCSERLCPVLSPNYTDTVLWQLTIK